MIKKVVKQIIPERLRYKMRLLWQRQQAGRYRGKGLVCNCCEGEFVAFKPFGKPKRENASCPYCGSLERTRFLKLFFGEQEVKSGSKLIHFAPEEGLKKVFQQRTDLDYIDADINPVLASTVLDLEDIALDSSSVDWVICSHVLAHVGNEAKALAELHRILKPGGRALLLTTIFPEHSTTLELAQPARTHWNDPVFRYHGTDFPDQLRKAGFKVNIVQCSDFTDADTIRRFSLRPEELIFECTKPSL